MRSRPIALKNTPTHKIKLVFQGVHRPLKSIHDRQNNSTCMISTAAPLFCGGLQRQAGREGRFNEGSSPSPGFKWQAWNRAREGLCYPISANELGRVPGSRPRCFCTSPRNSPPPLLVTPKRSPEKISGWNLIKLPKQLDLINKLQAQNRTQLASFFPATRSGCGPAKWKLIFLAFPVIPKAAQVSEPFPTNPVHFPCPLTSAFFHFTEKEPTGGTAMATA